MIWANWVDVNSDSLLKQIFNQDKNKVDVAFKLVITYFNLGEYQKSRKIAFNLYKFLVERLSPYRSLDNENILFRETFPFLGIQPESLHPNLLNLEVFNKYLIILNRNIEIEEFTELFPRDYKDLEEYRRKYDKAQEESYYLSINIYTFRKLKFLLFSTLYYILEIERRMLIDSLVFNEDKEKYKSQLFEIISVLKREITEGSIRYQRINDFLLFTKKLTELIIKDGFDNFYEKFPEFDGKTVGPTIFIPKEVKDIVNYLFYINMALPDSNFEWARDEIKKEVQRPELIAECMVLEVISLINYDLEKAYQKTKTDFKSIEELENKELNLLFPKWKYSIYFYGWGRGLDYIRNNFEYFIEFCDTHHLFTYLEKLKDLINQFELKLDKIIKKKSEGRKQVIQNLLKLKYHSFDIKKYELTIDLREKLEHFRYDAFLHEKILHEVFMLRYQNISKKQITFLLFDPRITEEIYQELINRFEPPIEVYLNLENNEIIFKEYYWTMPTHIKSDLLKFLDIFLYDLFDMFELKTDKYCVKYIPEMQDEIRNYFHTKFLNDFENPYFDFIVKDHPDGMYYSIKIKKKGVK